MLSCYCSAETQDIVDDALHACTVVLYLRLCFLSFEKGSLVQVSSGRRMSSGVSGWPHHGSLSAWHIEYDAEGDTGCVLIHHGEGGTTAITRNAPEYAVSVSLN